mgnify:FL=1
MISELRQLIRNYNYKHHTNVDLTLDELIYIVLRLGDSIRQDHRYAGGWAELVREVRRRLFERLNSGSGYRSLESKLHNTDTTD